LPEDAVPATSPEIEQDAFFPLFEDDGMKPDSNLFSNQAPVTSNDGRDQKRELCGGRSTEDVTSLAQKRMVQRLVGATAKRKLQCEDLLKDYGGGPNSKKGSKACSSSKSGKTSKGCKEEPTNKPTNPPTTAPTKSPTFSYNRRNRKVIL